MFEFPDRVIDNDGIVWLKDKAILELIYQGEDITKYNLFPSDSVEKYNKYCVMYGLDKNPITYNEDCYIQDHNANQLWNIPNEYKNIDLVSWFKNKITTKEEIDRVELELSMFFERKLDSLLKLMIYLVDAMQQNNIVWGVGRGSSVSSYCLFLIGIHRINSLKYNLDIKEFLK